MNSKRLTSILFGLFPPGLLAVENLLPSPLFTLVSTFSDGADGIDDSGSAKTNAQRPAYTPSEVASTLSPSVSVVEMFVVTPLGFVRRLRTKPSSGKDMLLTVHAS